MQTNRQPFPIVTIVDMEEQIDVNPDYQRDAVWSVKQQQKLIDSILRGYDIPKIYWNRVSPPSASDEKFEVVDGQQRLLAIWRFRANNLALDKDAEPIRGHKCAGRTFKELHHKLRSKFDTYLIDVVIMDGAKKDNEISHMFLRLQSGTALNAQEIRNAIPSKVGNLVRKLGDHKFFGNVNFKDHRYAYDHVAAQLVCIEHFEGPTNISKSYLEDLYVDNGINDDFRMDGPIDKSVKRVLNYLTRAFPEKTPEIGRYNVVNLYCIASTLIHGYESGQERILREWFLDFEAERKRALKRQSEKDIDYVRYTDWVTHSNDSKDSINKRIKFLAERFFLDYPDITLKDSRRSFSHEQRLAIYRKNEGRCQIKTHCNGKEDLPWDNGWHADHIKPHTRGGHTTVSNGQVACPKCNTTKGG